MPAAKLATLLETGTELVSSKLDGAPRSVDEYIARNSTPNLDVGRSGLAIEHLDANKISIPAARKIWFEVLVPELQRREMERAEKKQAYLKQAVPVGIACGIGGLFGFYVFGILAPIVAFAVFGFITKDKSAALKTVGAQSKNLILSAACSLFGFAYHPEASEVKERPNPLAFLGPLAKLGEYKAPLAQKKLLPKELVSHPTPALDVCERFGLFDTYNRLKFDDMITGERAGAKFSMVEATLKHETGSGKNRRVVTVFDGLLMHVEYPRRFLSTTVIARDKKGKKISKRTGLGRVDLAAKEFEDAFDVCSNDQVEARYLLTPDKLLRLIALERHFNNGKLQAVFEDGHMTIAIQCRDLFEVGSAWQGLVDESRFASCLNELGHVCDVIDGYMTRDWSKDKLA